MSDLDFETDLFSLLAKVDTPTVCNAIEVAQGQRGFSRFTRKQMIWSDPKIKSMVGYARTAKISGIAPAKEPLEIQRQKRRDYFRYMADGPRPSLAVIEDIDGDDAIGAWWGEVHTYVHKNVCQLNGAITNGLLRDIDDLAPNFPILAGALGVSHGFVHVVGVGTKVNINGLEIADGELVHADCHGAVVIPESTIPLLPHAITTLMNNEMIILGPVKSGSVSLAEFEDLWAQFEAART